MTPQRQLVAGCVLAVVTILSVNFLFISKEHQHRLEADMSRRLTADITSIQGRPFEQWDISENPRPCVPENSPDTQGFFYIKVPKTSSSTLGKITTRIAGRIAKRQGKKEGEICKIYDPLRHHKAYELDCGKRDKSKSFLWSIVRHPSDRAISHFGMRVKFGQVNPTTEKFTQLLGEKEIFDANVEMKFLSPFVNPEGLNNENYESVVHDILTEYNFIGTYERLYESLVVLSMLLNIDVSDVLFDFQFSKITRCGSLKKPDWVTPGMDNLLDSPSWRNREKGDYMLYDAIDKSLDMTIEKLGRENVERKLEQYLKLLDIGTGTAQNILNKNGCGVPGLHPKQSPFADIKDLFWVDRISQEDRDYISRPEFSIA